MAEMNLQALPCTSQLPKCFTKMESYNSFVAHVKEKLKRTNNYIKFDDDEIASEENLQVTSAHSFIARWRIRFSEFSREQLIVLAVLSYVYFSTYVSEEMLSTFFSAEVMQHGGNQFYIGLIFGVYPLTNCLLCPLFTYLLKRVSCRTMLIGGFATLSLSSLILSQIGGITSAEMFLLSCIILRILQATGSAAAHVASVFLVSRMWKTKLIFAFGMAEFFTGAAMIIGPLLGAWLYQIGGFAFPFYGSCSFAAIGFIMCFYMLEPSSNEITWGNFLQLLRIPNVTVTVIFMCFVYASGDLLNAELQVHMMSINASPITIGAMFLTSAISYLLVVIIVGFCAQTRFAERMAMICGGILIAISYLLIGPSPIFIPLGWTAPTVTSVAVSMLILGVGLGAGLVPNYNDINRSVLNYGMEDNETTHSLVGGLFNSAAFLGEFLGPILGGSMMTKVENFQTVSSLFAAIIASVRHVRRRSKLPRDVEMRIDVGRIPATINSFCYCRLLSSRRKNENESTVE